MNVPDDVPQTPPYVSPYGKLRGLPERLAAWSAKIRQPGSAYPFHGGLAVDLELAMRLLNLREFAQWLAVHGNDDERRWAEEIVALQEADDDNAQCFADIERVVPVAEEQPYADAVEAVAAKAMQHDLTRAVLEQVGAIAAGDTQTDIPALIRALLS